MPTRWLQIRILANREHQGSAIEMAVIAMTAVVPDDPADLVVRAANAGKAPILTALRSAVEANRRRCRYQLASSSLAALVGVRNR